VELFVGINKTAHPGPEDHGGLAATTGEAVQNVEESQYWLSASTGIYRINRIHLILYALNPLSRLCSGLFSPDMLRSPVN
jgi:hypothetical protein